MSKSFDTLPVELIDNIAQSLQGDDLVMLARTQRVIHGICTPWIYRRVILLDCVCAVLCLRTLASNVQCAHSVRALAIRFDPDLMLDAFRRLIRAALRNLQSLVTLDLRLYPEIFSLVSDIHFPRLDLCSLPFCSDIIAFLNLHPDITGLSFDPVLHSSVLGLASLPPIPLASLQMFSGPELVGMSTIPQSPVTRIGIFWNAGGFRQFFDAISPRTAEIVEFQNILAIWELALPPLIAENLPNLTSLSLRNVSPAESSSDYDDFIECVGQALPSLAYLETLSIAQGVGRLAFNPTHLDREFDIIILWGAAAPQLKYCILPSDTRWLRVHSDLNVWYPSNANDDADAQTETEAHDMLERFRWFVNKVLTAGTALPASYLTVLQIIGGKEMVAELQAGFEMRGVVPEFELAVKPTGITITFV
ncbi:hypothetical protein FB45DRAFT_1008101 [Roridomyces roridus]|uniref:F-box domain-containing protein n=1 Tax=Roridomyces roridus TaxID=1738132 RepID=A0AAD7BBA1_9AGAR|nr:hypothetical protein FB45DRAFT_1008101 [Roridomyces roridus]